MFSNLTRQSGSEWFRMGVKWAMYPRASEDLTKKLTKMTKKWLKNLILRSESSFFLGSQDSSPIVFVTYSEK